MSHEDELIDAAENGHLDVLLDLLGKGATVNAKDRNPDEHVPAADLLNFLAHTGI